MCGYTYASENNPFVMSWAKAAQPIGSCSLPNMFKVKWGFKERAAFVRYCTSKRFLEGLHHLSRYIVSQKKKCKNGPFNRPPSLSGLPQLTSWWNEWEFVSPTRRLSSHLTAASLVSVCVIIRTATMRLWLQSILKVCFLRLRSKRIKFDGLPLSHVSHKYHGHFWASLKPQTVT